MFNITLIKKFNFCLLFSLISIQAPINSQTTFLGDFLNLKREVKAANSNFYSNDSSLLVQNINPKQEDYLQEINDIENLVEEL